MKLWFENAFGEQRIIAEVSNWQEVWKKIQNFIDECNARKAKDTNPFKIYYSRVWKVEDGRTKIDVGSHSEFFYTDLEFQK